MRTVNFEYFENTINVMRVDRVLGRPVGVIGLARSGLSVAKLLKRLGGRPFVSDVKTESELQEQLAELREAGIPYETGGHTSQMLLDAEFLIVSPGVPNDIPILKEAEQEGIPVFSELEVASWLCDANLAAITGSNGKTTTTALLGEIFKAAGYDSVAAGNIGYPFSEVCDRISSKGWISLEVSSFQLERIFDFKPAIAVILNLTPDHLDRYATFGEYSETKMRIAENMTRADYLIINRDDEYLVRLADQTDAHIVGFTQRQKLELGVYLDGDKIIYDLGKLQGDLGSPNEIRIPGPHNLYNAMAAGAAALLAGISDDIIKGVFKSFAGVEHRLEYVDTIDGIRFINDSKATNVDSVWYALQSVPEKMVLIMGGKYKGGDLSRLNDFMKEKVRHLILIGQAAPLMEDAYHDIVPISTAGTLENAVRDAFEIADAGEAVMLSPACASFDMFDDFEHRGRVFKDAVRRLRG